MAQFSVRVKDKQTGNTFDMDVDGNDITTQEQAEAHVAALPPSRGGTHAGLEVITKASIEKAAADAAPVVTEPQPTK